MGDFLVRVAKSWGDTWPFGESLFNPLIQNFYLDPGCFYSTVAQASYTLLLSPFCCTILRWTFTSVSINQRIGGEIVLQQWFWWLKLWSCENMSKYWEWGIIFVECNRQREPIISLISSEKLMLSEILCK